MATSGDLINLSPVILTDTFNTWLNRTDQIIDAINPLQIYDLNIGATSGLWKQTGQTNGNYNGVVTISVYPGPGVGTRSYTDGTSRTIVDFSQFTPFGLGATGGSGNYYVQSDDEYLFNAVSDSSGGPLASGNPATSGTVKKVKARNFLPPIIDIPSGGLNLNGNVTIGGNLTIQGNNTFIAANNLVVQDKQFLIAYQQSVSISLTGTTGMSFTPGTTAYHFSTTGGLTSDYQGWIISFTGPAAGPTGQLVLGYPFGANQNAESFLGLTGWMSKSSTGPIRYPVTSLITQANITGAYLNDSNLTLAGLVVKGSDSDKTWLWEYLDTDTGLLYNAWVSNNNIAIDGNTNAMISRVYRSYGYTGVSQSQFIFTGEATKSTELILAEASNATTPLTFTGGAWKISRTNSNLVFSTGATGIDTFVESFTILPTAQGITYPGVGVTNFARGFNADFLDGAHGTTSPTAYAIPVAMTGGVLHENWINASSIRRSYTTIAAHGLTMGDVVRIDTTGAVVKAKADTPANAEAIGIVSAVGSTGQFTVTYKGKITGLDGVAMTVEGQAFAAGAMYFLSASVTGKMIADPDVATATKIQVGQVRKPILLAVTGNEGIVLNYVGVKLPTPTDSLYLSGLVPVGAVQLYNGATGTLSSEWLLCDGRRYRQDQYPDLYPVILGQNSGLLTFDSSGGYTGSVTTTTYGLVANDRVYLTGFNNSGSARVVAVDSVEGTVTFDTLGYGSVVVAPYQDGNSNNLFMVPDLLNDYLEGGHTKYIIRAKAGTQATILTGHDHDNRYIRYDNAPTLQSNFGPSGGATASNYRAKVGAVGTGEIWTRTQADNRYYLQATADARFVHAGGGSLTGVFTTGDPTTEDRTVFWGPITNTITNTGQYNSDASHDGAYYLRGYTINYDVASLPAGITAANGITSGGRRTIIGAFLDGTPQTGDSAAKAHVYGDFRVFGWGLTAYGSGGHTNSIFSVNPQTSTITIGGGGKAQQPKLQFVSTDGNPRGVASGLTSPTALDQAANKYYVDHQKIGQINPGSALTALQWYHASTSGAVASKMESKPTFIQIQGNLQPGTPSNPNIVVASISPDDFADFNNRTTVGILMRGSALTNWDAHLSTMSFFCPSGWSWRLEIGTVNPAVAAGVTTIASSTTNYYPIPVNGPTAFNIYSLSNSEYTALGTNNQLKDNNAYVGYISTATRYWLAP